MGTLFTLDDATKSVIQAGLDDLITELGKPCRLVYPPRWVNCANCVADPIGGKSSNHWRHGGPVPFSNGGICPLCNGEYRQAQEVTENIKLLCAWEPKKFFVPIPNLNITVAGGYLQTKGFLTDMPKILRAEYLVMQTPIDGISQKRFTLDGEPGDVSNIIQNRYFVATWKRT